MLWNNLYSCLEVTTSTYLLSKKSLKCLEEIKKKGTQFEIELLGRKEKSE